MREGLNMSWEGLEWKVEQNRAEQSRSYGESK